jgi:hypothetical protein
MLQIEGPIMVETDQSGHKPRTCRSRKLRGPYETFGAPGRIRLGVNGERRRPQVEVNLRPTV